MRQNETRFAYSSFSNEPPLPPLPPLSLLLVLRRGVREGEGEGEMESLFRFDQNTLPRREYNTLLRQDKTRDSAWKEVVVCKWNQEVRVCCCCVWCNNFLRWRRGMRNRKGKVNKVTTTTMRISLRLWSSAAKERPREGERSESERFRIIQGMCNRKVQERLHDPLYSLLSHFLPSDDKGIIHPSCGGRYRIDLPNQK